MKQIQVTLPSEEAEELAESLTEVVSPSQINLIKGTTSSLILITVFPTRTGFVMDYLDDLGIGRIKGRITITEIEATIPRVRPRKQDKFLRRISIEELEHNVVSLAKTDFNYISFIILSSIIAAMGLVTDNNITLIASMIVAPLMGPIVAMAFGAVTSNQKILKEGTIAELWGMIISIGIGFVIGLAYHFTQTEPSTFIIARGEPNIVDLVVAIASGLTAGICFVSGTSLALVGVAAAAALLPVVVNVGISLGMFEWRLALGSLVLFITNLVSIHLGCMIIFWIRKVEPPKAVKRVKAKKSLRAQLFAFGILLLVVALPITQTSIQIGRKWRYQKITNDVTTEILQTLEGVVFPPEKLEVSISATLTRNYVVNITIRIFSSKQLPNGTNLAIKQEIENRAKHPVNSLILEVIIIQEFEPLSLHSTPEITCILPQQQPNANPFTRGFIPG
ncbi:MAG: TIGR00341 family protein [Candidatus Heimdallarchaeota archaeon]|nr:TIGR00341 family protein [Candidatus Heimdallarchaeota archaeon]